MAWEMQLDGNLLEDMYKWLDSLPLSRPKQRIERDFSDGVLVAEIIAYYLPELVDLANYTSANSLNHKKSNWTTLQQKVLSKLGLDLSDVIMNGLSNGKPGLIEVLLFNLRLKIDEQLEWKEKSNRALFTRKKSKPIEGNSPNELLKDVNKAVSQLDLEEIKQQYLQQEEQIRILQAKLRRLEHVLELKDKRINELLNLA